MGKLKTPELDKMSAVQDKSQAIGSFLDWMKNEKGFVICRDQEPNDDGFYPVDGFNIERILSEYFEIDLNKVEKERRKLLASLREK